MKRTLIIILSVVAVFLILGISFVGMASQRSATLDPASRDVGIGGGAPFQPTMAPAAEAPASDSFGYDQSEESSGAAQAQERLVIENADLAIVVRDPRARMQEIGSMAREFGGFVVSSNIYQSTSLGREVPEASIVIRVPSQRLDEALDRIKEGAVEIEFENRSGQDVTSQYVDLKSQLAAKEAAEQKLLEIMDQATRAEDVLAIYLQVQSVQTEIEVLKGQIQYLEESAALSAISVRLIAEAGTQPIEVGPWSVEGAAKEAIQDLILFVQNFAEFLVRFVLYTLPALILIAIPLFLVFLAGRAVYRRVQRSNEKVEAGEELKK
ncbi:MAG TPA: DUF4349 domain-containing protein [Anaerolineales bacterium]|nr:DUF4349 domain-containing protein [Anaerolineales bacterium]